STIRHHNGARQASTPRASILCRVRLWFDKLTTLSLTKGRTPERTTRRQFPGKTSTRLLISLQVY
ncbi:MAG: hypothetical protein ACNA77_07515, partial [Opitutales bacterium]